MVDWYKDYASKFGTVLNENPSPGNVAGGLLNITIKSLGAIAKAGTTRVEGVTGYAERPSGARPVADAGPRLRPGIDARPGRRRARRSSSSRPGRGTTIGNAIAPVIKLASNTAVFERMSRDLDLSAGGIIDGTETIEEVGARVLRARARVSPAARCRPRPKRHKHREFHLGRAVGVALMRAAVLVAPGHMHVRDVPVRAPEPSDVLLRVGAVGLCGTDFHIFSGHGNYHSDASGTAGSRSRSRRRSSATSSSAIVEEAGARVSDVKVGDRVVVDQGRNCVSQGAAAVRVLRHRRLPPVRALRRARHHGPARRPGRVRDGARRQRDPRRGGFDGAAGAHRAAGLRRPFMRRGRARDDALPPSSGKRGSPRAHGADLRRGPGRSAVHAVPAQRARLRRPDRRARSRTRSSAALQRASAPPPSIRRRSTWSRPSPISPAGGASSTPSMPRAPAPSSRRCPRSYASRARCCSTGTGTQAST